MPAYDSDTLLAGHDSALVDALQARGVRLTPFEVLAISHSTYTRSGLLRYAGTTPRFVDPLVRQIRQLQDGIPGPCRADVEALRSAGLSLQAVAQGMASPALQRLRVCFLRLCSSRPRVRRLASTARSTCSSGPTASPPRATGTRSGCRSRARRIARRSPATIARSGRRSTVRPSVSHAVRPGAGFRSVSRPFPRTASSTSQTTPNTRACTRCCTRCTGSSASPAAPKSAGRLTFASVPDRPSRARWCARSSTIQRRTRGSTSRFRGRRSSMRFSPVDRSRSRLRAPTLRSSPASPPRRTRAAQRR